MASIPDVFSFLLFFGLITISTIFVLEPVYGGWFDKNMSVVVQDSADIKISTIHYLYEDIDSFMQLFSNDVTISEIEEEGSSTLAKIKIPIPVVSDINSKIKYSKSGDNYIIDFIEDDLKGSKLTVSLEKRNGYDGTKDGATIVTMDFDVKGITLLAKKSHLEYAFDYGLEKLEIQGKLLEEEWEKQNKQTESKESIQPTKSKDTSNSQVQKPKTPEQPTETYDKVSSTDKSKPSSSPTTVKDESNSQDQKPKTVSEPTTKVTPSSTVKQLPKPTLQPVLKPEIKALRINNDEFIVKEDNIREATISGKITNPVKGQPVYLMITKPDGSSEGIKMMVANSGNFGTTILLDNTYDEGIYKANVKYGETKSQTISYKVEKFEQTSKKTALPEWVKSNARWWGEGQIEDSDFVPSVQYLIKEGIIEIEENQPGINSNPNMPEWIKKNAVWWGYGIIDDDEFVNTLEYLVRVGIIKV